MEYITIENQIPLTNIEFDKSIKIIDKIQLSLDNRYEYCIKNNLDLNIHLPAAQWGRARGGHMYPFLEKMQDKEYDTINNLRLYCFPFTGYCRDSDVCDETYAEFLGKINTFKVHEKIFSISKEDIKSLDESKSILTGSDLLDYFFPFPIRFGEFGILYNDRVINSDTKCCLEQLTHMREAEIFKYLKEIEKVRKPVILEIGGGYGRLAYQLMRNFKNAEYLIVDIPESLLFSSIYLSILLPDVNIKFINNYELDKLNISEIDLIINTISMSEFLPEQVDFYCKKLVSTLSNNGIFFENNENRIPAGFCNAPDIISKYFNLKETLTSKLLPYKERSNLKVNIWSKK